MKVTTTPAPRSTVVLEVELPADRLQRSIDESVRQLARRTRVPGFRPGKAPRAMLERTLGVRRDNPLATNPIYDEAKERLFESTVVEALRESDADVLTIPQPEWLDFTEGSGARYRVTVPVRPDVKLGDYLDYPFAPQVDPVDDGKVDKVIEELRDQHASLAAVEDRPVRKGDWVVIGYHATRDGQPFEGGDAERMPLVVGDDRMIPGFEDQLVGMSTGGEKDFELTYPSDYPDESLRDQPVRFHVVLREVREKILPPLDDDFAEEVGAYADLDALRADARARLTANALDRARHEFSDRIIEYAVGNATLEVPDYLIEQEVEVMHDELRIRLTEQGIPYEEYLKATGRDDAAIHADYREPAEHRVKVLLVLSAIAEQEGVELDDGAVEAEVQRLRDRYRDSPRMMGYFDSDRGRSYLRSSMRRTQLVEQLVDRWLAAHPEVGPLPHLEDGVPSAEGESPAVAAASTPAAATADPGTDRPAGAPADEEVRA